MALTKVSNSMLVQPVQPVNHNILINPSFTVNQRGDVVDHATTSYGPDRWKVWGGGTKTESSAEQDLTTGITRLVVKHEGTTTDWATAFQVVEAVNLQGLYGKEMTLSFGYSDVGGSGIPNVFVYSDSRYGAEKKLYDAAPTSLGDNRFTCTFTLSTSNDTGGEIPGYTQSGISVSIRPNEANNAPNEWRVWETKLEAGSVATPFVARSYGEELALCQRYFERHKTAQGGVRFAAGLARPPKSNRGENFVSTIFPLLVEKRESDPDDWFTYSNIVLMRGETTYDISSASVVGTSGQSLTVDIFTSATLEIDEVYHIGSSTSTDYSTPSYIDFNAEL